MEKHQNHSTDERARMVLRRSLPPERWQVYDISPDYAQDNPVELIEHGRQTGISFAIQLKGKRSVKPGRDGRVSFRLEVEHLIYFMSRRDPVFVVVVDVTREIGWW